MATSDDLTPQERLDADPEFSAQLAAAAAAGREGTVPRRARTELIDESVARNAEVLEKLDDSIIPPELRPGRW